MKRFGYIVFSACLLTLGTCISHEPTNQEEDVVKVSIGLTAASSTNDAVTRTEQPMAPDYGNLIGSLWIPQSDREGILIGSEQIVLTMPMLSTTLERVTLRTGRSTLCIVDNLTDAGTPAWSDNLSDFKSLVAGMGWMKEWNTDRNVCPFSYYEEEVTTRTAAVNVVLGRLVCRLNIAVSAKTAGVFSNVKVRLKRAQIKGYLFPSDTYLAPKSGDYTEKMITTGALGITSSYRYYHMMGNVTIGTNRNEHTQLQIRAMKGGTEYTKNIDPGRSDINDYSLRRNNNHTFNIILE